MKHVSRKCICFKLFFFFEKKSIQFLMVIVKFYKKSLYNKFRRTKIKKILVLDICLKPWQNNLNNLNLYFEFRYIKLNIFSFKTCTSTLFT